MILSIGSLKNTGRWLHPQGINGKNFKTLVDDLFRERLLIYENASEKIVNFSSYQQTLIEHMKTGTPEEQDFLWRSRGFWQMLQDTLNELYIEIENTRLKNAETQQEYSAVVW